jgi:glycosyltransferase involved in cell wall biosynthesis
MPPRLWFDVEDLFDYAAGNRRPSGIQRVAFEVYRALQQSQGTNIGFLRHDRRQDGRGSGLRVVSWPVLAALFERLSRADVPARRKPPAASPARSAEPGWRRLVRRWLYRLPPPLRVRLLRAARLQWQAAGALAELLLALGRQLVATGWGADGAGDLAAQVRPGDVLVLLGAPWPIPDHAARIAHAKAHFGLRCAVLVYDLLPIRRPEWCSQGLTRQFGAWFAAILPQADIVMAISQATAADVARYAAAQRIALPAPLPVIPMGSGFAAAAISAAAANPRALAELPAADSYILFVSSIEAHKNHQLLLRVWRRLLDDLPAAAVPTLVFAGRAGWLVGDLLQQLANCGYLDGRIRHIADASDAQLVQLYRGCRFTVFPSLHEGWGLPVTESMALGKPCIVARSTALPEAGGQLARYFDPDSVSDAYAVIRAAIEDAEGLRRWTAEVARAFVPMPWSATAAAVLDCLQTPSELAPGTPEALAG